MGEGGFEAGDGGLDLAAETLAGGDEGEADRRAHLAGQIPIALGKVASDLLSAEPVIDGVTIVAVK